MPVSAEGNTIPWHIPSGAQKVHLPANDHVNSGQIPKSVKGQQQQHALRTERQSSSQAESCLTKQTQRTSNGIEDTTEPWWLSPSFPACFVRQGLTI